MKKIEVEGTDDAERTDILESELKTCGYKLPLGELVGLLKGKVDEKLIDKIKSRKVCVVGPYQTPTMVAAGLMKLDGEYGFYFSILKTEPGGPPEARLIIENAEEFEEWFRWFRYFVSVVEGAAGGATR